MQLLRLLLLIMVVGLGAAEDGAQALGGQPALSAKASQEAESDFLSVKLVTHPLCAQDIHRLCASDNSITLNENTSNLDVMSCLLDQQEEAEDAGVSPACHHVLWQLRHNLTRSASIVRAVGTLCPSEKFEECDPSDAQPGHYVSCVLEQLDDVQDEGCADFLENLAVMVFTDYRMIYKFAEDCGRDIDRHQCGRLEDGDEKAHSQGKTIECISNHMNDLSDACKLQVLRVAELQAEDYHMDRPLYFACRDDRERFCASTVSGNGKVYQCLVHHKMEKEMSKKCRKQLTRRQKMTSIDYKVSKRLRKACKPELAASGCHQAGGLPDNSPAAHSVKLGFVLLCLDDYQKQGKEVSGECVKEMVDHRRALMEDYTLSPELIMSCADDIQRLCSSEADVRDGQVIHCLMLRANPAKVPEGERISAQCQRQVEDLLHVADVAEDWKVDPVLQQACGPVVRDACSDAGGGDGAVLSCLAETMDSDAMTSECEQVLLQIQYFVSRDFKLDPQLYKACHTDAVRLCHASEHWWRRDTVGANNDPMVLPCLYRNAYHSYSENAPPEEKISDECRSAVRRVMKHRTDEVDLRPEIEGVCMEDLAKLCSERAAQRGHEITCLQDSYQQLTPACQKVIKSVTQDEARYIELNPIVAKVCKQAIKQNCMQFVESGGVLECLIEHKNDPDIRRTPRCYSAINHFQIISLSDYTFSYKFKQNCQDDIGRLCSGMEKKADVMACLSSTMLNDTLAGRKHRVTKPCRQQVLSQVRQQEENEALDPRLNKACGTDIHAHCRDESEDKGSGKVLECLREHVDELTPSCSRLLFRRQQQSLILPKADYFLFNACKGMILKYCTGPQDSGAQLVDCLKAQAGEPEFDPTCERAVSRRLAEQKRDYRLHPALRQACLAEARQHCAPLLRAETPDGSQQGRVTACLAAAFRAGQLSAECGRQLDLVLREAARDVRQDPLLQRDCADEMARLCAGLAPDRVGECLREQLAAGARLGPACAQRVARIVEDVNVDVHTDPQLSAACALDLQRHCAHVPAGGGAQLACLSELHDPTQRCADMLTMRMKMMAAAMKVQPVETVHQLYTSVRDSPNRDFFVLLVFGILVVMFFGGLCCGRVTKRAKYIQKMK